MDSSKSIPMTIYKDVKGYVGKFTITSEMIPTSYDNDDLCSIVLLDCSGSMGSNTSRLVKKIIPAVFEKLSYVNEVINIIAFETRSRTFQGTTSQLRELDVPCGNGTNMLPAIEHLRSFLLSPIAPTKFRILAISDGILEDQLPTMNAVTRLAEDLNHRTLLINSQVVRFYTSEQEPDTRGLSSIMQLNTMTQANVVNLNEFNDNKDLIDNIVDLFKNDGFGSTISLNAKDILLKDNPWGFLKNQLYFPVGESIVWLNSIDTELTVVIPNKPADIEFKVELKESEEVSLLNYASIFENKMSYYLQKLKVLKIVNTEESIEEMNRIVEYFAEYESALIIQENAKGLINCKISSRVELIKGIARKRRMGICNQMRSISNDNKINELNSKQQVEFLREIKETNRVARGLAKRALLEGIDFDQVARDEVVEMAKHLDELKDIDDSLHSISFYSTCTTMDGIREVCCLTKDPGFEEIMASDIIKLINLVGVACKASISNYPDPMTYRLEDIYPGTFISLSDILIASEISKEKRLNRIGTTQEITNAIPIFEDERIHLFLLKYAPKLLEYSAGIGMRRVLAHIPYTYEYTLLSGIWKMIQLLFKDKSEVNIITFASVLKAYPSASKDHFGYVLDLIENQKDNDLNGRSIFLANNGITNLTYPLLSLIKQNDMSQIKRIIRALYQYEIYQFIRKQIKRTTNQEEFIQSTLNELLGIDYEKNGTKLPPLFETNTNPVFNSEYEVNDLKLNEIMKQVYWSDFISFVPEFYKAALSSDPIKSFREKPEMNDAFIKEAFGLEYELRLFRLFSIVQAFLFRDQTSRSDTTGKQMKIIDLVSYDKANKMVKDYVYKSYLKKYNEEYQKQTKKQLELLSKDLIEAMLNTESIEEYIELFSDGLTRGVVTFKLYDVSTLGFIDLKRGLLDMTRSIPKHAEKLKVFLLGKDDAKNAVWNNGNVLREPFTLYEAVIKQLDAEIFKEVAMVFKENNVHVYRDEPNRQGHSNVKVSYWAKGYASLEEMYQFYNQKEIFEYKKLHFNCCGFGPEKDRYKIKKRIEKRRRFKQNIAEDKNTKPKKSLSK